MNQTEKKKYRFDFIREYVEQWRDDVKEQLTFFDIYGTPMHVNPPFGDPIHGYTKATDYYGETIDDMDDYFEQRKAFCRTLYKEIRKSQRHPFFNSISHAIDRLVSGLEIFFSSH